MKAVKSRRAKTKSAKTRPSKSPPGKARVAKAKTAKPKPSKPVAARAFRFTAADVVQIHFPEEKKPESFRVDDMVEASLVTSSGQVKRYYQYRLVSNDKANLDGSERHVWFLDPSPVVMADELDPSLWQPVNEVAMDGEVLNDCSGAFSTRSVTSYDGSGSCHVVRLDAKPVYRMRLDLNGKREFCESMPVTVGKGDVLVVSG